MKLLCIYAACDGWWQSVPAIPTSGKGSRRRLYREPCILDIPYRAISGIPGLPGIPYTVTKDTTQLARDLASGFMMLDTLQRMG